MLACNSEYSLFYFIKYNKLFIVDEKLIKSIADNLTLKNLLEIIPTNSTQIISSLAFKKVFMILNLIT